MNTNTTIVLLIIISMLSSCINHQKKTSEATDYSDAFNWVSLPLTIDKKVDVFYVYPTIYAGTDPLNMEISNLSLREKAKGLSISQAGAFSNNANLFAPFYRQQTAASQSMSAGNMGKDAYLDPIFQLGAKDIEDAFNYYLEHLNSDRPFILASHSQGTMTLINLMRKRFNNPKLQKRLVAAYLIGYSITDEDLKKYPWMKLAKKKDDTGVIITYNTETEDAGPSPVLLPNAHAINPLNWKTDSTLADRNDHLGAKFFNDEKGEILEEIPHFANAYIDTKKGILVIKNMKTPHSKNIDLTNMGRWSKGVYHKYDYAFFFNNLQENAKLRIDTYLQLDH